MAHHFLQHLKQLLPRVKKCFRFVLSKVETEMDQSGPIPTLL